MLGGQLASVEGVSLGTAGCEPSFVAEPMILAAIPQTRTHAISLISLTSATLANSAAQASYPDPKPWTLNALPEPWILNPYPTP